MNTLPTKPDAAPPETEPPPTWRQLAERMRDLMKDLLQEGRELERDLEPKLLPALKRMKVEIEKLIAKLEERAGGAKRGP
jgi:signal transduction histidine kinase